jgi:hypothetical protein
MKRGAKGGRAKGRGNRGTRIEGVDSAQAGNKNREEGRENGKHERPK